MCVTSDLGPQLLAGSSGEQRENLGVTTADYYFYLNQSGTYTVEDVNDKKEFSDTMVTKDQREEALSGSGLRGSLAPLPPAAAAAMFTW